MSMTDVKSSTIGLEAEESVQFLQKAVRVNTVSKMGDERFLARMLSKHLRLGVKESIGVFND
jgi:hypothetical protein